MLQVKIMKEWDPTGRNGPRTPLPDVVKVSSCAGTLQALWGIVVLDSMLHVWIGGVAVGSGHQITAHAVSAFHSSKASHRREVSMLLDSTCERGGTCASAWLLLAL